MKRSQKRIPKRSKKQSQRLALYAKCRASYFESHRKCEVEGCTNVATEIHHKGGRDGDNLFKHLLAVCREHHQFIENNPLWAKEEGYSISRLANET